jgi:transposase
VARAAGIHVSQLFRWRKSLCERHEPAVSGFLPVAVERVPVEEKKPDVAPAKPQRARVRRSGGRIEIELAGGDRIRFEGDVEADALRRVLDVLRSR